MGLRGNRFVYLHMLGIYLSISFARGVFGL